MDLIRSDEYVMYFRDGGYLIIAQDTDEGSHLDSHGIKNYSPAPPVPGNRCKGRIRVALRKRYRNRRNKLIRCFTLTPKLPPCASNDAPHESDKNTSTTSRIFEAQNSIE